MKSKWARKTELVKMARQIERYHSFGQDGREKTAHDARRRYNALLKHYTRAQEKWGFTTERGFLSHL